MDSSSPARPQRRVRNLLSAYYAMDDSTSPEKVDAGRSRTESTSTATAASAPPNAAKNADFGAADFSPEQWFSSLLQAGHSVPRLMKMANALESEIRNLDSELQTHMYENYAKFITATDTIHSMSAVIRERLLPNDLKTLEDKIHRVDAKMASSTDKLEPGNRKITSLLSRQEKLEKVRLLLRVPEVLKECLRTKQYGRAAEVYCKSIGALRKRPDVFEQSLVEVDLVMRELKGTLEARLRSQEVEAGISTKEALNCSKTLLELGADANQTASVFLAGRTAALDGMLVEICGAAAGASCSTQGAEEDGDDAFRRCLSLLSERYAGQLREVVDACCNKDQGLGTQHLPEGFVEDRLQKLAAQVLRIMAEKSPAPATARSCLQGLVGAIGTGLAHARGDAPGSSPTLQKLLTDGAMLSATKTWETAQNQMVAELVKLHATLSAPSGADLSSSSSKSRIGATPASAASAADDKEKVGAAEHSILLHACLSLTDCQPLFEMLASSKRDEGHKLVEALLRNVKDFFVAFVEICKLVCRDKGERQTNDLSALLPANVTRIKGLPFRAQFALALVRMGRHLETRGVGKLWSVGVDLFGGSSEFSEEGSEKILAGNCRQAAAETLARAVEHEGAQLGQLLRSNIGTAEWCGSDGERTDIRAPRTVVHAVVDGLRGFEHLVGAMLGDQRKPNASENLLSRNDVRSRGNRGHLYAGANNLSVDDGASLGTSLDLTSFGGTSLGIGGGGSNDHEEISLDVERLLARSAQIYAPVAFNRAAAMSGVVKILLKSFSEDIRLQVPVILDIGAVQQLQLDAAYLAAECGGFVLSEDLSTVDGLVKEVVASACGRFSGAGSRRGGPAGTGTGSKRAELLDAATVDRLVHAAIASANADVGGGLSVE